MHIEGRGAFKIRNSNSGTVSFHASHSDSAAPSWEALFKKSPEAVSEAARYQAAYEARVQEQLLERPLPNGDGS